MQTVQGLTGPDGDLPVIQPVNWQRFGVKNGTLQPTMRSTGEVAFRPVVPIPKVQPGFFPVAVGDVVAASPTPAPTKAGRLTGPLQFILKLLEFWRLEQSDAVGLLGFDQNDADHVAAVLEGRERFRGRDVQDRIGYLYSIRMSLWSLFRNLDVENSWLREPQPLLEGRAPLGLLAGSMDDLLLVQEYIDEVAGR